MRVMKKTSSFVIICIYIIKSLCKDVISVSIENNINNIENNSVEIEIKGDRNRSRDNFISGCSSGSSESCEKTKQEMRTQLQNARKSHQDESNSYENAENRSAEIQDESIQHRTGPRFNESAENMQAEPERAAIFSDKIISCKSRNKGEPRGESVKESKRKSMAPRNSIEVRDHKYQANIASKESAEEDKESRVDYPYTVSIQRKGAHYASGALVGESWVLSTAEEFYNVRETIKLFRIRLGSINCKKGGSIVPIKSITIHPYFTPGLPSNDISVLRIVQQFPASATVKAIGISRIAGKVVGGKFLTTYWPKIVVKQGVVPPTAKERVMYNIMRVSTQTLVPSEECGRQFATVNVTLARNSLCLKPMKRHHSVCMPDVGAPVVAVDGLWGITSGWVSPKCPLSPLPTVFTRVSTLALRTWIESQMLD